MKTVNRFGMMTFHARLFSMQHANNQSYTNSILIEVYIFNLILIKIPFIKSQKFGEAAASPASPVPRPLYID